MYTISRYVGKVLVFYTQNSDKTNSFPILI